MAKNGSKGDDVVTLRDEALDLTITIPAQLTVRQQLAYKSMMVGMSPETIYERNWLAAQQVIEDFTSPHVGLGVDLDTITGKKATDTIVKTGEMVFAHMNRLETVDPN